MNKKLIKTILVYLFKLNGELVAEWQHDGTVDFIRIPGKRKPKLQEYYTLYYFNDGSMTLSYFPPKRISKRMIKQLFDEIDKLLPNE